MNVFTFYPKACCSCLHGFSDKTLSTVCWQQNIRLCNTSLLFFLFALSILNICKRIKIEYKALKVDMLALGDNHDLYKTPRVQKFTQHFGNGSYWMIICQATAQIKNTFWSWGRNLMESIWSQMLKVKLCEFIN